MLAALLLNPAAIVLPPPEPSTGDGKPRRRKHYLYKGRYFRSPQAIEAEIARQETITEARRRALERGEEQSTETANVSPRGLEGTQEPIVGAMGDEALRVDSINLRHLRAELEAAEADLGELQAYLRRRAMDALDAQLDDDEQALIMILLAMD